jgi:hypothetical protein
MYVIYTKSCGVVRYRPGCTAQRTPGGFRGRDADAVRMPVAAQAFLRNIHPLPSGFMPYSMRMPVACLMRCTTDAGPFLAL